MSTPRGHIDRQFDARLAAIRDAVQRLGEHVDTLIALTAAGVARGDEPVSEQARREREAVDRRERELEHVCMVTLATRAPVASDLGQVMLAMRVSTELGRVADLAKHIEARSHRWPGSPGAEDAVDLAEMAELARAMWRGALTAFAQLERAAAAAVLARDAEVNSRYARIFDRTIAAMARDAESVESGVFVQGVAKRLERMADHACRAAEAVITMIDGDGMDDPDALLRRA